LSDEKPILHHYWLSPYAEKIRRIFGFKNMAWRSVEIPVVMPKPDLLALTGGYRKTPVLQIGADIYCDTECIARVLESRCPEPTLFPRSAPAAGFFIGPWQQELFSLAVYQIGVAAPVFPDGFIEDRTTMREQGYSVERILIESAPQKEQLRAKLSLLDDTLGSGGPFLFGKSAGLADFSVFHPLYALRGVEQTAGLLEPFSAVRSWLDRIEGFGLGDFDPMSGEEAVEVARDAEPLPASGVDSGEPNGIAEGDKVRVVHENFGNDPVAGEVSSASIHEIVIEREDERAGCVAVHFPREHYMVTKIE
jgi:glutathione S-transferase